MSQTLTPEPTRPNRESSKKEKISFRTFASHPAFLLFIGFIFTGIIGTFITSKWQRNEWDRQQARLVHIRRIDQKEKVMEELVQAIADSNATEEDVLNAFSKEWRQGDPRREDITEGRLEAWQKQGGRDWRIATEMIQSKLNFYFTRKDELLTIFNGILGRRANDIVPAIYRLEADYKRDKNIRADLSFIDRIAQIRPKIDDNRKDLQQMLAIMLGEIQRDVEST